MTEEETSQGAHGQDISNDGRPIPVDFVVMPEALRIDETFPSDAFVAAARASVATRIRALPDRLRLQYQGRDLKDNQHLTDLGNGNRIAIYVYNELRGGAPKSTSQWKDVIDVNHDNGDGSRPKVIRVAIERPMAEKPFIGGLANRLTGRTFHHGVSQTDDQERLLYRKSVDPHQRHRTTQTIDVASRTVQTSRESGTQMQRPGLVLDSSRDREVQTRTYIDADEVHARHLQKIIQIQCFVRSRFACRRVLALLNLRMTLTNQTRESQDRLEATESVKRDLEINKRLHPKKAEDFAVLFEELEMWCVQETERIQRTTENHSKDRHRLMRELLNKEVRLLQTIDRLRFAASIIMKKNGERQRLTNMAAPKIWTLSDGEKILVQDPHSLRARDLHELHTALRLRSVTVDERLDMLLHVKWIVKRFDSALTREISELIDREADMLTRGRPDTSLSGLRHRITNMFYRFVCIPEFNPQAVNS